MVPGIACQRCENPLLRGVHTCGRYQFRDPFPDPQPRIDEALKRLDGKLDKLERLIVTLLANVR